MHWAQSIPEEGGLQALGVPPGAFALARADPPAALVRRGGEVRTAPLRTTIIRVRIRTPRNRRPSSNGSGAARRASQLQALRVGFQLWAIKNEPVAMRWMQDRSRRVPAGSKTRRTRQLAPANPAEALRYAALVDDERRGAADGPHRASGDGRIRPPPTAWIDGSPPSSAAPPRDLSQPDTFWTPLPETRRIRGRPCRRARVRRTSRWQSQSADSAAPVAMAEAGSAA
jgi:hypothetical protein